VARLSPARIPAGYVASTDAISLLGLRRTALGKSILVSGFGALTFLYAAPVVQAFRTPAAVTPLASFTIPSFALPAFAAPPLARAVPTKHASSTVRPLASHHSTARPVHRVHPKPLKLPVVTNKYDLSPAQPKRHASPKVPTYTDTIGVPASGDSMLIPMPAAPATTSTKSGDATPTHTSPATSIPSTAPTTSDAVGAASGSDNVASPPHPRVRSLQDDAPPPATVSVSNATVDPNTVTDETAAGSSDAPATDLTVANVSTPDAAQTLNVVSDQTGGAGGASATQGNTESLGVASTSGMTSGSSGNAVIGSDPTGVTTSTDATADTSVTASPPIGSSSSTNARGPPTLVSATTGGTVTNADGSASVTFEPGSLTTDAQVTITNASVQPTGIVTAGAYDLKATAVSTGATIDSFNAAPLLTIAYDPNSAAPDIYYVTPQGDALRISSVVDPQAHTVTAALPHFSIYATGQPVATSDLNNRVPIPVATLTGSVLAPDGSPVQGATVEASSVDFTLKATTDDQGQFSLGVTHQVWTVKIDHVGGYQTAAQQTVDASAPFLPLVFQLQPYEIYMTGIARELGGAPIAGVRVRDDYSNDVAYSAADGTYKIGLLKGSWHNDYVDEVTVY